MARILITSALPGINGVKHLGNLVGSLLPADVYARFERSRGNEVLSICGTDDHGTPAELAAAELGQQAVLAAGAAVIGHLFPVWLGFKGGKGVATFIGLLLGFGAWIALLGFCVIWLGVAFASRYSSLAALIASAATPAILWAHGDRQLAALFLALAALLWIMHRANITRILNGTESKIGRKAEAA